MLRDLFQWLADSFLTPTRPVARIERLVAPRTAQPGGETPRAQGSPAPGTNPSRIMPKRLDFRLRPTAPAILAWRDLVVQLIKGRVPSGTTYEGDLSLAK